jgi:hypothetical protein
MPTKPEGIAHDRTRVRKHGGVDALEDKGFVAGVNQKGGVYITVTQLFNTLDVTCVLACGTPCLLQICPIHIDLPFCTSGRVG